jgi:hypothetical protein
MRGSTTSFRANDVPNLFGSGKANDPLLPGVPQRSGVGVQPKAHLPTVCNPASPTCSDPALPVHITSHRTEYTGSSKTSSTSCPRLSLKLPRNLKPSWDLSTIRQGNIFWTPLRVMTRLARFFVTIRLDRRRPWIGELGIDLPLCSGLRPAVNGELATFQQRS